MKNLALVLVLLCLISACNSKENTQASSQQTTEQISTQSPAADTVHSFFVGDDGLYTEILAPATEQQKRLIGGDKYIKETRTLTDDQLKEYAVFNTSENSQDNLVLYITFDNLIVAWTRIKESNDKADMRTEIPMMQEAIKQCENPTRKYAIEILLDYFQSQIN